MRNFLLVLFLLTAMGDVAMANDGVYYTSGNFLVPIRETDISAKKEILEITLCKDGYANVTVDYTFFNHGKAKTVTMAFEANPPYNAGEPLNRQGIHPNIQEFTVLFNGQALPHRNAVVAVHYKVGVRDSDLKPLDLTGWKGFGDELPDSIDLYDNLIYNEKLDSISSFAYAYYFDAPFKEGENKVRHTYRYKMSYAVGCDFRVPYWLKPVTRWANGQVDDFTLRVKSEDDREIIMNDSLFLSAPFTLKGIGEIYQLQSDFQGLSQCLFAPLMAENVLEWHGTNFAPTEDICIEPLNLLKGGEMNRGRVAISKDGREARYLADSGDNYFVEVQDYGLVPKEGTKVEWRDATQGQGFVYLRSEIKKANVRQWPSLKSQVLFTLDNDGEIPDCYPCLGFLSHKEADGNYKWWYKVDINGKIGYISEKLLMWNSISL